MYSEIGTGIEPWHDWIRLLEASADVNHVHYLIQSTPHSPSRISKAVKSVTAMFISARCPEK